MREIEFHIEAEYEVIETSQYYEQNVEGLGEKFLDDIEEGKSLIEEFPYAWSIYDDEYRRYLLKYFPYGIIYRISSEKIYVIAVAHLHRKPGYWRIRKI